MTDQTTEFTFLKSSRKRRIAAFVIDHFVLIFLMVYIVFIALGPNFMDENNPSQMMTTMLYVMIPGFNIDFAKDSLKGISAGKLDYGNYGSRRK